MQKERIILKKTISIILAAMLLILSFAACGAPEKSEKSESAKGGLYNFKDYKSSEIFDIEKIKLSDGLAEKCVTYKFSYLSDGGIIKAYISIPNSALSPESRTNAFFITAAETKK